MPAKKARGAKASPRAAAAARRARTNEAETYDVASMPLDDAADSPHQTSVPASQKGDKRTRYAQESGTPASTAAADSLTAIVPSPGQQQQPTLGETQEASLAETSLQALVDGADASAVADAILIVYCRGDKETALCAILNVLAKAAGVVEVELDANALVDGVETRPLLEELYARVPADSEAYLLVNKSPKYRKFRNAYPLWCAAFVLTSFSRDILLDTTFLPVLSQWVIAMSESKSRAFRHTATVALLAFVHALSSVAAHLQNQLALLRTKKDVAAVQRTRDDVVEWRDHLFSQAVHQRLRDVAPDIRLAGFQALHKLVLEFPDEFMTNKYLRYLGMPLHDKQPELRAEALNTILRALLLVPDAYSRMHLFLQYFTNRLVELSSDVDVRCAELAIGVVATMVRGDGDVAEGSELLTNEKIDQVLLKLFDERPTVRVEAGSLLKVFIESRAAGEETEAEQNSVATELLCSFAATLRAQYREMMPERYLIDAIWNPELPPAFLVAYEPILAAAQSDKPLDAVVGLQLLAALLLKLQGRLTVGPVPRDDRRGAAASGATAHQHMSPKAKEAAEELRRRISEDVALVLCSILEVHHSGECVLEAAALVCSALDMSTFTSKRHHTALSALLIELRKATLLSPCAALDTREALTAAWHQLAYTEHPLRSEAQAHLQELLKNVVAQFSRATVTVTGRNSSGGSEAERVRQAWGRMNLLSGLVSTTACWPQVHAALTALLPSTAAAATTAAANAGLAALAMGTAVQCLLWQVKEAAEAPATPSASSSEELQSRMRALVTAALQFLVEAEDGTQFTASPPVFSPAHAADSGAAAALVPLVEVFVYLCDILALPFYNVPQAQQETLVRLLRGLYEPTSLELHTAQDYLKLHVQEFSAVQQQQNGGNGSASSQSGLTHDVPAATGQAELVAARRSCSRLEALQLRLVTGVVRLFVLRKLDSQTLAAPVLALWTQSPSKAVADTFKSLFHTLRDRTSGDDGYALEHDTVLAAYNHCVEVGATPASMDALYQIGFKLASLHFSGTDRFYRCCPAMVQFGADFAASTDPLLLQAVAPYASKLRPADALHVLRDQLSRIAIFTETTNPFVRVFVAALRRAAKLDSDAGSSPLADDAVANTGNSRKRPRVLLQDGATELPEEEGMLAAIAQGLPAESRPTARGQRISAASRVVTADGWHVAAHGSSQAADTDDTEVVEVDASQRNQRHANAERGHRSVLNAPSSQETNAAVLADGLDGGEVFVATEEYE